MATCKKCIHYDACKAILDAVGIEMDEECPNQEYLCGNFMERNLSKNTMTNADRIRSMSDEELAKLIAENAYTGACNDFGIPHQGQCCHNCERCDAIIKWLKHPAE